MKLASIIAGLAFLACGFLFTNETIAQPGTFTVTNNSGCTYLVGVYAYTGTKCGDGELCGSDEAYIDPGDFHTFNPVCGSTAYWAKFGIGVSYAADCEHNQHTTGPTCGSTVHLDWINASNGELN